MLNESVLGDGELKRQNRSGELRACWLQEEPEIPLPGRVEPGHGEPVRFEQVRPPEFEAYLDGIAADTLAVALIPVENDGEVPPLLQALRARSAHERTRVFLLGREDRLLSAGGIGDLDVESVIDRRALSSAGVTRLVEQGVRAYRALGTNPLLSRFYLDATYNRIFDWFETTRWDWSEVGELSNIDKSLLRSEEIEILKESAIIEFGTLPGAHNFLREWGDEYSFSSWALAWGAEEARHSLLQCRYLREIGIDVPAKHAMYKREPYPMGKNRAGTLMMNIISEARAAEYYRMLANQTREPVLKRIWTLLGRDEARHARAFFVFCKELCEQDRENLVAALEMAYVWLADRREGVKHPAGFFYPHSTSTAGLRELEKAHEGVTDAADARVFAMIRNLLEDPSIQNVRDLKGRLRAMCR